LKVTDNQVLKLIRLLIVVDSYACGRACVYVCLDSPYLISRFKQFIESIFQFLNQTKFTLQQTSVVVVHLIGAFLAFAVGFVYIILQTIISFKSTDLETTGNTPFIRKFRIVLCVVDAIFLILCILLSFL
jgi:hypothetical protein